MTSEKTLNFTARHELIFRRLEKRSVAEVEAYICLI